MIVIHKFFLLKLQCVPNLYFKGHFPLGGIFRAERHFLLFKDQLERVGVKDKRKYHSVRKIPPSGKRPLECK